MKILSAGNTFLGLTTLKIRGKSNVVNLSSNSVLRHVSIEINGYNNTIEIGESVRFYESCKILISGNNCRLHIGKYTTIGSAELFVIEDDQEIFIGDNCMISRDVYISTSDFHSILTSDTNIRLNKPERIYVASQVWIGNAAKLNKGTCVQEKSIVGGNAILSKQSFPSNSVIAGFPAKVIRSNVKWSRDLIN